MELSVYVPSGAVVVLVPVQVPPVLMHTVALAIPVRVTEFFTVPVMQWLQKQHLPFILPLVLLSLFPTPPSFPLPLLSSRDSLSASPPSPLRPRPDSVYFRLFFISSSSPHPPSPIPSPHYLHFSPC